VPRVLLVIGLIMTCAAAPAQAVVPGANGRIAFDSDHDGASDIYTVESDGSGVQRLTTANAFEDDPSWSPDGTRIAYIRGQEIWVMNADGSGQHRITRMKPDLRDPAWSPDGRSIMFATEGNREDIWAVAPDGSDPLRITSTRGPGEFQPSWAPDGSRIAYVRVRNESYKVVTANPDGSAKQVLLAKVRNTQLGPNWSPDGRQIVYYSEDGDVFVVNADGSGRRRAAFGSSAAFSPDGQFLALSVQNLEGTRGTIFKKDLANAVRTKVSPFPTRDLSDNPDWQAAPEANGG
jgi:Tol biopolymer transport system component